MVLQKAQFLLSVLRKWTPRDLAWRCRKQPAPTHVMFCMVDHFEPGAGGVPRDIQMQRMRDLMTQYPRLADRHRDADGVRPARTWFFPPHDHRYGNLRELTSLCGSGYGEVELHLHHGKTRPDTPEHLEHTIRLCIEEYSQFGIFGRVGAEKTYGFIHGDWALDNSRRHGRYCGVDNELSVLKSTGCYADFTFPSCNEANPAQINSIYYAREDGKAKSHNRGTPARVGGGSQDDLLIVQGPLHPILLPGGVFRLRAFGDDITWNKPCSRSRVDHWVRTWIHVQGRPDWVFVKVHTHGTVDADVVLGPAMDETFQYLEDKYNDGAHYVLHYVTARELYNIVSAAEAGAAGSPGQYRDYRITAPRYDAAPQIMQASKALSDAVSATYVE